MGVAGMWLLCGYCVDDGHGVYRGISDRKAG